MAQIPGEDAVNYGPREVWRIKATKGSEKGKWFAGAAHGGYEWFETAKHCREYTSWYDAHSSIADEFDEDSYKFYGPKVVKVTVKQKVAPKVTWRADDGFDTVFVNGKQIATPIICTDILKLCGALGIEVTEIV